MEKIKVAAQPRQKAGVRGELSKLRATKQIPAVVYGAGKDPITITIAEKDLIAIQKAGGNEIVELTLPNGVEQAIIKEVQYHVVKDTPIHIDFQRISMDHAIETVVPVVLTGECAFAKANGAIVDHVLREVTIKCLPADIPHHIEIDIKEVSIDNHITVADIKAPKGVTILGDGERTVVHVILPKDDSSAAAPAADAAAQPELSASKGKKEEGEAKK